jgi:inorganic pyrophosphatase
MFQAHPWHGVPAGDGDMINAYVEITTTDTVKYELDKASGHLRIDRPQPYSSGCPSLYGFIPRTYCGDRVGRFAAKESKKKHPIHGDRDPLDICVLTEKMIPHGDFLCRARPIGGLRMIDRHEADDKIIAVLDGDSVYGALTDLRDCPAAVIARLEHYFLTYKLPPGRASSVVEIAARYGARDARKVIGLASEDYLSTFGDAETRVAQLRSLLTVPGSR